MQDSFYYSHITGLDPDPINKVKFTFDNDYAKNGNFEESADEESCGHTLEPNLEFDFLQDTKLKGDGGLRMIDERDPLSALEDSEDDDSIIIKNFGEQSFDPEFCTKPNTLLPEHAHHQEKRGTSILEEKISSSPEYNSVKQDKPKKETPVSSTKNMSKGGKIHVKSLKEDKLKQGKKHSRRNLHAHVIEPIKDDTLSFSTGSLKRSYTKKSGFKTYNELLSFMQSLSKINWTETDRSSAKLLSSKVLNPSAFWFLTCANYFPRNAFAHKNIKEFVHQRLEKLKNLVPDIPQRLDKNVIKTEVIQRPIISVSEQEELSKFSKAIKGWVDISRTNEYFERTMSARTVNLVQKFNYSSKDDEWISEIKTFISDSQRDLQNKGFCEKLRDDIEPIERINLLSKIELQDLISLYEKNLYQESLDTERRLIELEDSIFEGLAEEDVIHKLNFEPNDSLVDLRIRFPEEDHYLNFLEKKYAEAREMAKKGMETETEEGTEVVHHGIGKSHGKVPKTHKTLRIKPTHVSEEYTCQICNDNCLNDEDLIVYCSACNLAVHQTCYGITTIPQGDWICDGCLNFGQNNKYLRCPFCSVRGGAMKPTQLRADTNIFKSLNPNYHAFLKSYVRLKGTKSSSRTSKKKQSAMTPEASETSKSQTDSKENTEITTEPGMEEEREICQDLIEDEPRPKNVWAHITCALFLPELYFKDSVKVTQIAGAENLTKEKFDRQCEICATSGTGAVVTCAKSNCKRAFHVECARKEKFYLDIKENEQNQMIYHIYCDKHIPLELKRTLENREKQTKQEIESFFKAVEKHLMTLPVEPKASSLVVNSTTPFPQEHKSFIKKKKKHHYKDDIEHFMKQIEKYQEMQAEQAEQPQIIMLEKINEGEEEKYKVIEMPPVKPVVKKGRKLKADDDIWIMMPYKKLTAEQKYKKYKKYLAHAQKLKLLDRTHKENMTRSSNKEVSTRQSTPYTSKTSQSAREIYCVCQKPYKGELMIACEKCGEWYHPKCVGLVDHKNLRKVSWNCPNCTQNGQLNEVNINTNDLLKRPTMHSIDEEGGAYISKKLKTEKRINTRSTRG